MIRRAWPLVLIVLLFAGGALWWLDSRPGDDTKYLLNRVWVERVPRGERDMVHYLVLVDDRSLGSVSHASAWRVRAEVFKHQVNGRQVRLTFPQDQVTAGFQARTFECDRRPFNLCLTMVGKDKKTVRFFSRHDWTIGSGAPDFAPDVVEPLRRIDNEAEASAECPSCRDEAPTIWPAPSSD